MRGNGRALDSAIANLIDNALRAEPEGGCVQVRLCRHGHGFGRQVSEPENQSNLEMNALWNHFVFPVIGTAKRAFIFNLSGAQIMVVDHGAGVSPDDRTLVFEPFWRKDERPPGTGLGLSIVRAVARLHHGDVQVGDTPGGGATFVLWLPISAARATPAESGASRVLSGSDG